MPAATRPADPPAEPRRRPSRDDDHRLRHPWLLLVPVVAVVVIAFAINRIEPGQPGPFYTPPAPLPAGPAGTIIRTQPIAGAPAGAQAWLVLYLSTGLNGQPVAVSGTVFAPTGTPPAGGRPVIAWAHPTTGIASRCAPSLEAAGGAGSIPGLAGFLQAGYVVAATDYPGLGTAGPHPYLVGASEAMAVLDSVRAARNLGDAGAGTSFGVWGHSQGGHAALFTGQLAPTYAPELQLVGVATAAPATQLATLLEHDIGGLPGNVLASMAVVSWSAVYAPTLTMDQVLQPTAIPTARLIGDNCIESEAQVAIDLPEAEIEKRDFLSTPPWQVPAWQSTLQENTPGSVAIKVPVLVNQGTADTIVWPGVTADWVASQCALEVRITEKTYDGITHTDIAKVSAADTVTWMAARFANQAATSNCTPATSDASP
jgi:alpha-beta hydrolase superfamily lysophospholipase